jgi:two-component system NarL family sensor kinase
LAALGMRLARLVADAGPTLKDEAKAAEELLQQLNKEIRTTSYLLHPPLLDEIGLSAALSWYVQGLRERSHLDIQLQIPDNLGRFSADLELAVFRLVQECLTNVHRHSGSKSATIDIQRRGQKVWLTVQDQGKGITPKRLGEIQAQASGLGIRGMRERIHHFGGELNIESNETGTKVVAIVPLHATDPAEI